MVGAMETNREPIIGISRLRMGTDGHGIRTLVAFHGCCLSCKYCLNPKCLGPKTWVKEMSPEEVMHEIAKDELYYIATKGGVTFGGGEPLLKSGFIKEILELGAKRWNIAVETSLNVPKENLQELRSYINEYIVDIKDMNPNVYQQYTGNSNEQVKSNLKWLIDEGLSDRIICRIPLIPGYNSKYAQEVSKELLIQMGIRRFDLFTYKTPKL
jgi:pyruvate formate lyase activating enzyme